MFQVLSSVGSVSSGLSEGNQDKKHPKLTVSEQYELGCGGGPVNKDAESHRGIVAQVDQNLSRLQEYGL